MTKRQFQQLTIRRKKEKLKRRKAIANLIVELTDYMRWYYADPSTGRPGVVLFGPEMARLSTAASLRSLLEEELK